MTLATKVQKQVDKAITKLVKEGLGVRFDYVSVVPGAYNSTTDSVASVETVQSDVEGVTVGLAVTELSNVTPNRRSQKLLVARTNLTVTPKEEDRVVIAGESWEIKKIKSPPGGALVIFFIQEP